MIIQEANTIISVHWNYMYTVLTDFVKKNYSKRPLIVEENLYNDALYDRFNKVQLIQRDHSIYTI
jgi:hypothetical protein